MNSKTKHIASITIPSHPMYLSMIRAFIEKLLLLIDTPPSVIEDIKSGVDEACSNVIKYAYNHDYTKSIKVSFNCSRSEITVTIEDEGAFSSCLDFKGRDLSEVRPGGLGIHFIKKAFDKINFRRVDDTNRLILIRKIKKTTMKPKKKGRQKIKSNKGK